MTQSFEKKDILDGKMFAVLSYLSILCIIPLILKKDNPFVLAHGKQGLVLFVGQVATMIISIVFAWALKPLMFVLLLFAFWGVISSIRGRMVDLPLVARIANQIVL